MIVEFIGTPGAGKTTLLPTVVATLDEQGIKAFTVADAARPFAARTTLGRAVNLMAPAEVRKRLLWQVFRRFSVLYRLRFFARHPRLILTTVRSQQNRPASADVRERRVLDWFMRLAGYFEFLSAHAETQEALILDEGFVHRVVQLNASGVETPNPAQIKAYVDRLPQPDLVIYAYAPPEICEKRIYSRGLWDRFRHKEPEEIAQFVANAHAVVRLTVNHIRRKGWTVIEVDNSGDDPTRSQEELREKLAKIVAQRWPYENFHGKGTPPNNHCIRRRTRTARR